MIFALLSQFLLVAILLTGCQSRNTRIDPESKLPPFEGSNLAKSLIPNDLMSNPNLPQKLAAVVLPPRTKTNWLAWEQGIQGVLFRVSYQTNLNAPWRFYCEARENESHTVLVRIDATNSQGFFRVAAVYD